MAMLIGWFPANGQPLSLPLLCAFAAGSAFSAVAGIVVSGSMLADVADEHELTTGRRQEGVFFGALAFAVKASSGLGSFLAGLGIDAIGFPAQASPASVDGGQVQALGILYAPGIALLAIVAIAFLARYRIDRARHAEIARELAARRLSAPGPR
jgi:GPH family glycoside/pentoside/hexuronide:cation symporter